MAYFATFEKEGDLYQSAYFRIQKVYTANVDYERFEHVDEPGIEQRLTWETRVESKATVFVWDGPLARGNRAHPIGWFSFDFTYDLTSPRNIYQQAYDALASMPEYAGGDGDV
jgi:hypothetical protein